MSKHFLFFFLLFLIILEPKAKGSENYSLAHQNIGIIGGVIDYNSRVGKEQRVAMEMAMEDFNKSTPTAFSVQLVFANSKGYSAGAASAAIELIGNKHVEGIIGSITLQEANLAIEVALHNTTNPKDIHIVSLTSPSSIIPPSINPNFIQMSDDISIHIQCLSALIGHFQWRQITIIYEQTSALSTEYSHFTLLSDSLKKYDSEVQNYLALPPLSSIVNPKLTFQEALKKLKKKSNRVFVVVQSSLEFSKLLFENVNKLHMMEKGYVWIVTSEVASLLDSVDSSVLNNMKGVLGLRKNIVESTKSYKEFKARFRRIYGRMYPQEEEFSNPSVFALRAYDATWTIARTIEKLEKHENPSRKYMSNNSNGYVVDSSATIQIVNVVGKSYNDVTFWTPTFGFSLRNVRSINKRNDELVGLIHWPGGERKPPTGWTKSGIEQEHLKIAVPENAAFKQFVSVNRNVDGNVTIDGFSVDVFHKVVSGLPYLPSFDLVPCSGSYNEMVQKVYQKVFYGAIGDIGIISDRYKYGEFSQPYMESGLVIISTTKPDYSGEIWMFTSTFTTEMWVLIIVMHIFIGFVVWLIEHEHNSHLNGFGTMVWFSITLIFFMQREPLNNNLARLVLGPWLFFLLILTSTFTAILSSKMTLSRLRPSVLDIETLLKTNAVVGCNGNSFIGDYLVNILDFKEVNVKKIYSIDDYPGNFTNKDIQAAFFTAPHAKVFLAKYCNNYTLTETPYRLGGFGFVFQKNSHSAYDIFDELLKITEKGDIKKLETQMLSKFNCTYLNETNNNLRLGTQPFIGLFYICGCVSIFALLVTIIRLVDKHLEISSFIQAISIKIWRLMSTLFIQCYVNVAYQLTRKTTSKTETSDPQEMINYAEETSTNVVIV